jgi:hypothetical protein
MSRRPPLSEQVIVLTGAGCSSAVQSALVLNRSWYTYARLYPLRTALWTLGATAAFGSALYFYPRARG